MLYRSYSVLNVQAFKCVSTVIRNSGKELPEERCMRRDVRKMVGVDKYIRIIVVII